MLCATPYPRGSFSEVTDIHQGQLGVSLTHAFAAGSLALRDPIKPAFAFTLYIRFLTGLSRPLSTLDLLSRVYRPSRAAHQSVSPRVEG